MKRRKQDYSTKIFVLVILVVFVASGFAIASFSSPTEEEQSNAIKISGYTFYASVNGYITKTEDNKEIAFLSDPKKVENISIDEDIIDTVRSASKVYLAYNPNQEASNNAIIAASEIARMTDGLLGINTIEAFSEDTDPPNMNMPLKTCSDSIPGVPVIEIRLDNNTEVRKQDNCIIVEGKNLEDQRLAADKLAMWLAGIRV